MTLAVIRLSALAEGDIVAISTMHCLGHLDGWHTRQYILEMDIQLSPEQQKWLKAEVEAGHFASFDDALCAAIVGLMAAKEDDLAWAKPLVDEALESIARGDASTLGEFRAEIRETIAKLR